MMVMSLPRTWRMSRSGMARRSRPLNRIEPDGWRAAGYGRSFITESAVADLPEPDSPTSATVSPLRMSKEMRATASTSRLPCRKATERFLTSSRFSATASIISPERLARIERVAHRLANENQQREHEGDDEEAR